MEDEGSGCEDRGLPGHYVIVDHDLFAVADNLDQGGILRIDGLCVRPGRLRDRSGVNGLGGRCVGVRWLIRRLGVLRDHR